MLNILVTTIIKSISKKLLKAHFAIWDMISDLLEKGFYGEPAYNKYIQIKTKLHNGKINTKFQGNKIPEKSERCAWLPTIFCHVTPLLRQVKNIIRKYF